MCDAFDVLPRDFPHATYEHDDPLPASLLSTTPLPDGARTLRRTISHASIDTIRPLNSNSKGVRRRINEIADSLKNKSTKKKKDSSTQDVPKKATRDRGSDSKVKQASKATKHGRKATAPLRDASHRSGKENVLVAADRLHSGVPSERGTPLTLLGCEFDPLVDKPLPKEDEQPWEDSFFPTWNPEPGAHVTADGQKTFQPPQTSKIDIKDVQLDIRPSESDVTIWDGLCATHHLFKCRLFLRCTTHPYDSVSLPDIRRFEMNCNTHPFAGSRYARPPVLQTTYRGASPGCVKNSNELPNVKLAAGIHIDRSWRTILEDDGTWGWYRDAYIPLSPQLFDKMEYREFKLVSRVWLGESCVESESTFGISMLLREVEMK